MGINILQINDKTAIPYEIVPLLAGAYVGYNNAQGVNVGTAGLVATYAPTAFATGITSISMLVGRHFGKRNTPRLEKILSNDVILRETVSNTLKSGAATAIGYGIGYVIGSMSR